MSNKLEIKIKKIEEDLARALNEESFDLRLLLDFPKYRELPDEVILALKIIENHGGRVIKQYTLKQKPKEAPKEVGKKG